MCRCAEFREEMERVETRGQRVPPLVYKQLLKDSLAELQTTLQEGDKRSKATDADFDKRRVCCFYLYLFRVNYICST